jgi:hypothetical protein
MTAMRVVKQFLGMNLIDALMEDNSFHTFDKQIHPTMHAPDISAMIMVTLTNDLH